MSSPTDTTSPNSNPSALAFGSLMGDAVREGAKDGASAGLAMLMADSFLKTSAGKRIPALVHTPAGKAVVAFLLPVVLAGMATFMPDVIPAAPKVYAVSMRAVRGHTAILFAGLIHEITPWLQEIAGLESGTATKGAKPS